MKLSTAIQEALVAVLCLDDSPGGARTVAGLIEPEAFDSYFRQIARGAIDYLSQYGRAPGEHTLDIVDALKAREPEQAAIYERIYRSMVSIYPGINREYVLAQAGTFARYQRMKSAIARAIDSLQRDVPEAVDEADALLRQGLDYAAKTFDPGTYLHDPVKGLSFLEEGAAGMATGIPELDRYGLGPTRGQMLIAAGRPGRGKSWLAVHLGKQAFLQRLRVLHVTLEMPESQVVGRYYQSLFSLRRRDVPVVRHRFERDERGSFVGLLDADFSERPYILGNKRIKRRLLRQISRLQARTPVLVKAFPTGSLTIEQLYAYLDALEGSHRFIPDLILVDYPDLMKLPRTDTRIAIGQIYKELRGLASARNAALAVFSPLNREGERVRIATESHLGEDDSKGQTADTVWTLNQTAAEQELGLLRLYVAKGRADRDKFTVLISTGYAIGQFCLDSMVMREGYWDRLEGMKAESSTGGSAPDTSADAPIEGGRRGRRRRESE